MSELRLTAPTPENILIRTGTLADLGILALVMERAYAQRDSLALPANASEATHKELEDDYNTPGAWTHVAVTGGTVAGFALGFPASEAADITTDPRTEYLSLLMVEPEFWGRGIASCLLDKVEDRARQADKQQVVLWTRQTNNRRTQSVYERRQYNRTSNTKDDGPYGPQYQYRLNLLD